jgi:hypothetical protein
MGALVVVKANPVPDDPTGMLQGFKSVVVHALAFQHAYHPRHHAALFRAVAQSRRRCVRARINPA